MNKKIRIPNIAFMLLCSITIMMRCSDHRLLFANSSDDHLVTFLQDYIRINTSHPFPEYEKAINFLINRAVADGFAYQLVPLPSGRNALIITYQGTDASLSALALNHHMDVVPATNTDWIKPPFAGEMHDGQIIGRGTQDMKGIAAVHYGALKELKQCGIRPRRTIHLFAVPDEEVGGFTGTKEFIETSQFKNLNIGFVLDEGHASGNDNVLEIKVGERKPIQVQVMGKGELAHGSHLQCYNVIHELVQFLRQIVMVHREQQEMAKTEQPGKLLSCNITSLTAGIKKENGHIALNMVPDTAQATIDIRVPPTLKRRDVLAKFEKMIRQFPHLSYAILAQAEEEPELDDYHTQLYIALSKTLQNFNYTVQPHFFEASSDLRFYQARGIDGVGLTPFTVTDNIHGINESLPIKQLMQAKKIMTQFLKDFCI